MTAWRFRRRGGPDDVSWPFEAASWFAARVEAARFFGCDPDDLVTVRRGGK